MPLARATIRGTSTNGTRLYLASVCPSHAHMFSCCACASVHVGPTLLAYLCLFLGLLCQEPGHGNNANATNAFASQGSFGPLGLALWGRPTHAHRGQASWDFANRRLFCYVLYRRRCLGRFVVLHRYTSGADQSEENMHPGPAAKRRLTNRRVTTPD